jgi:hypothetical protein
MFLYSAFKPHRDWPRPIAAIAGYVEPFRIVNGYGLFRVMTKSRPEIVIEGSADGIDWRPYDFKWKPGALEKRPRWVAPHQPRLDWQMWFAALGAPSSWFIAFLGRLLEGAPEVLKLLESNPFPDGPPRMVRAVLYDYKMADLEERRRTGTWWKRERLGLYVPPLALAPGPTPTGHVPRLQRDAEA